MILNIYNKEAFQKWFRDSNTLFSHVIPCDKGVNYQHFKPFLFSFSHQNQQVFTSLNPC